MRNTARMDALGEPGSIASKPAKSDILLSRATLYALFLRESGYAPDEAAWLVASRYPQTRSLLNKFLGKENAK